MRKKYKIITIFLCLLFCKAGTAQKFEVDRATGIVTVNNIPAFTIKKNDFGFTIVTNSGKEVIDISGKTKIENDPYTRKFEEVSYMVFTFRGTGNSTWTGSTILSLNIYKIIAKHVVQSKLIVNDEIDPAAEKKFLKNNDYTVWKVKL